MINVDIDNVAALLRAGTGFFKKIKAQKTAKAVLQPYCKTQISNSSLGFIVVEISEYISKKKQLLSQSNQFERMTGLNAYDALESLGIIRQKYDDTKEFLKLVVDYASKLGSQSIVSYFVELANSKNGLSKLNYDLAHNAYVKYQETDGLLTDKYMINKDVLNAKGEYFEQLLKMSKKNNAIMDFLKNIDVLVDGPFIQKLKSYDLKFRGSSNQRIIDVQETLNKGEIVLADIDDYEEEANYGRYSYQGMYI